MMLPKAQRHVSIVRLAGLAAISALPALLLVSCSQSSRSDDVLMVGETPSNKNDPYPDFSKPLTSAMDQMSNEEAQSMSARLSALSARRRSGAISEAEYWRRVREMRALNASMQQVPKQ